ncbi:MAG: sigma-54-dependent Fis family transcriptional regulator [Bacteroidales bacterium]|nr:sigma-54-dependent Fis family transcriptional regulator [Bacteroidales bacterium]
MKPLRILFIDDEKLIRWSFEKQLSSKGHKVFTAETGEEGLKLFELHYPDVIFVDNRLPKMQELEVISKIKSIDDEIIIVFMTAYGSIEMAVEAMKLGAFEYINKPFSFEEINIIIDNIKNKININKEIQILKRQQNDKLTFKDIVCQSKKIKDIINLSKKIAKTESTTILLLGESLSGKDVFARSIHNESNRNEKPFVTINCSSLPETLLESELFGYEKGAFTDAKKLKKGLFEIAENGTVFLDEIGEINISTQVKLLGVLENRYVRRLGGTVDIPVNVRIIAATNKDILKSIADKTFREDLYYRLKVFQITLPPLRERKEDVPLLIDYFIELFNSQFGKKVKSIEPEAKKALMQYNWPGNIRELRNVIERAIILETNNTLYLNDLPGEISNVKQTSTIVHNKYNFELPNEGISLYELEKQLIIKALQKSDNNQTKASKLLGISRDTLRYKQKKYKL